MGADRRTTNSVTKAFSYAYNLDGSLATLSYPSGRVVTYAYNAAARALSAVDSVNSINYATGATYAPQGALASLQVGASAGFAGVTRTWSYNQRLQPQEISAASPTATVFSLTYDFDLGVANNGNVMRIVNNLDSGRTQSFTYDGLNRLQTAEAPTAWGLSYTYDRYGNLYTRTVTQGTATPLSLTVTSQNRLEDALDPSYYDYDAAGNMVKHGLESYTYDAENRMTATAGVSYDYDGDGRRVQKSSGTLSWYGVSGDVLLETDSAGNSPKEFVFFGSQRVARRDSTGAVYYFFEDHLGSARLLTDSTGTVVEDSDFYPFGGERPVVSNLDNNYKFTGQERDAESGLDYFGARYYSSGTGRFTSVDPGRLNLKHLINPQKWNKYAYTIDNPLRFFDPNGEAEVEVTLRAFIPQKSVAGFSGDNRGFSGNREASSRTSITVKVETDPAKRGAANPIIGRPAVKIGTTTLNVAGAEVQETATGPSLPSATAAFDKSDNTVIQINQNVENPLAPGSLGIRSDLTVTIPKDASSISVEGTISGSPSFEVNVSVDGASAQNIQLQQAAQGDVRFVQNLQKTVPVKKPDVPLKKKPER